MPKVMLIEDDRTMLSLLQTLLNMEGFDVAYLERDEDPEAILCAMRLEKPSLVLVDVNLRKMSGFDLLHAIRQDAELKPVRVLMSSGMDFGMRSYEEGADGFILKPYMPDELIQKIRLTIGV
jgi:DNA-binding response OmpR family regulator